MKVTTETVAHLAHLARLNFDKADEANMVQDLNRIVAWVDKLSEVNTDGVAPLVHLGEHEDVLRTDAVKDQLSREQALTNAPKHDGTFFRVPKVVDK